MPREPVRPGTDGMWQRHKPVLDVSAASAATGEGFYLLKEDEDRLLQENGDRILKEDAP